MYCLENIKEANKKNKEDRNLKIILQINQPCKGFEGAFLTPVMLKN